jgi:hypothetical protein
VSRKLSASVGRERFAPTLTGRECSEPSPASAFPSRTFFNTSADGTLLLDAQTPLPGSHRHLSNLMGLYPFNLITAEGRHRVSARREHNATTWFRVVAGGNGVVSIRDNFGGRAPQWNRRGVTWRGSDYVIPLKRGDILEATLAKPETQPAAPPNAAEPVVLPGAEAKSVWEKGKRPRRPVGWRGWDERAPPGAGPIPRGTRCG